MRRHLVLLLCGCFTLSHLWATTPNSPDFTGLVTRAVSGSDFDVNGIHILCGPETQYGTHGDLAAHRSSSGCPTQTPYLGQPIHVAGAPRPAQHAFFATLVEIDPNPPATVKGVAVIDALPPAGASASPGSIVLRADGYFILVTPKTTLEWGPNLHTLAEVKPGDWIEFKGQQRDNGLITADSAKITRDVVTNFEKRMREKTDYGLFVGKPPADKTAGGKKQHPLPIELQIFVDAPRQARVDRIGNSLIPAFQRNLPPTDPARFDFHFVLVDQPDWRDVLAVPSGFIFVPYQLVDRLSGDTDLAVLLADGIARVLEKQSYYAIKDSLKFSVGEAAGAAAGITIPGAVTAAAIAGYSTTAVIQKRMEEQSGRVSLGLLRDAGYDPTLAPKTWWLLAAKDKKPMSETSLPARAAYLYRMLGVVWHTPPADAAASPGSTHDQPQPLTR